MSSAPREHCLLSDTSFCSASSEWRGVSKALRCASAGNIKGFACDFLGRGVIGGYLVGQARSATQRGLLETRHPPCCWSNSGLQLAETRCQWWVGALTNREGTQDGEARVLERFLLGFTGLAPTTAQNCLPRLPSAPLLSRLVHKTLPRPTRDAKPLAQPK